MTETAGLVSLSVTSTTYIQLIILPVNDAPVLTAVNNNISDAVQGQLIDIPVILSDVDAGDSMGDGLVSVHVEAEMEGSRLVIGGNEIVPMPLFFLEMAEEEELHKQQKTLTFTAPLELAKYALAHLKLHATYAGNHAITVTVNDTGNYGSGRAMVTSTTLDINVTQSTMPLVPVWVVPSGVLVAKQGSQLLVSGIRMDIPWSNIWTEQESSTMRLLNVSITIRSTTSGSSLKTSLSHFDAVALGLTPFFVNDDTSSSSSSSSSSGDIKLVGTIFGICQAVEMPLVYVPPLGFTGIDTLTLEAEAVTTTHSSSSFSATDSIHGTWNWSATSQINVLVIDADHPSQCSPVNIKGGEALSVQYEEIIPVTTFSLVSIQDNVTTVTLTVKCGTGTLDLGSTQAGLWIQSQSSGSLVSISGLPEKVNNFLSSGNLLYKSPTVEVSDTMVERSVDLCAWI